MPPPTACPPYAAEGVNMAMLDALELTEALLSEQFPDIQTASLHAPTP
jgi:2-polyprenyl-6-methoxyphenol hydroxylase-like FAD-dependent oxidoreductase